MPTIQHITSMQRRASASGGNAGTRTVLDVDFGSVPRSGQLLAVRNPVAMDAAGTWQFSITVDYYEQ